ncbi:hypothetical protein, partial [Micrococcoides hystricis]
MTSLFTVLMITGVTYAPVDFYVYHQAAVQAFSPDIYSENLHSTLLPAEGLPFVYTPFTLLLLQPLIVILGCIKECGQVADYQTGSYSWQHHHAVNSVPSSKL